MKIAKNILYFMIFFIVNILLTAVIVISLQCLDAKVTTEIEAVNNCINHFSQEKNIGIIKGLTFEDDSLTVQIENMNSNMLVINNLYFKHSIYINEQLVSQNIASENDSYDANMSYKTFHIENQTILKIVGENVENISLFLGEETVVENNLQTKMIISTLLMALNIAIIIIFSYMFFQYKKKVFLLFVFMGLSFLIKSVNLGIIPVLFNLLAINYQTYLTIDVITTAINSVIPIIVVVSIFDLQENKKFYNIALVFLAMYSVFMIIIQEYNLLSMLMLTFMILVLRYYGLVKHKDYANFIIIQGWFYVALVIYYLFTSNGYFSSGLIEFFVNASFLGASLYITIFAIIFIKKNSNDILKARENDERYERISLLRGVSHDLKLPISVIRTTSQMIQKYDLEKVDIKAYSEEIVNETIVLENMVNNINAYLKLERYQPKEAIEKTTDVSEVLKQVQKDFNTFNEDGKYNFVTSFDQKKFYISLSYTDAYRLIFNLVDNAFKYSRPFDEIRITSIIEDKVVITIEDTGIGIEKEKLSKIFDEFYRVDDARKIEGLGLGLSVVKRLVAAVDGEITFDSTPGVGTKVTVIINK